MLRQGKSYKALEMELADMQQSQAVVASFLVSVLREKHQGRVYLDLETIKEVQGEPWTVVPKVQKELGTLSLEAVKRVVS